MLQRISICDMTVFHNFVYYPVRDIGDDCVEAIKEGPADNAIGYSVYGEKFEDDGSIAEHCVADFSVLTEAIGYCMMLNASLKGQSVLFDPPKSKEE